MLHPRCEECDWRAFLSCVQTPRRRQEASVHIKRLAGTKLRLRECTREGVQKPTNQRETGTPPKPEFD